MHSSTESTPSNPLRRFFSHRFTINGRGRDCTLLIDFSGDKAVVKAAWNGEGGKPTSAEWADIECQYLGWRQAAINTFTSTLTPEQQVRAVELLGLHME